MYIDQLIWLEIIPVRHDLIELINDYNFLENSVVL